MPDCVGNLHLLRRGILYSIIQYLQPRAQRTYGSWFSIAFRQKKVLLILIVVANDESGDDRDEYSEY